MQKLLSNHYLRLRPRDQHVSRQRIASLKSVGFTSKPRRDAVVVSDLQSWYRQSQVASDPTSHGFSIGRVLEEYRLEIDPRAGLDSSNDSSVQAPNERRRSLVRRLMGSEYYPTRAAEIISLLSLSARSSFRSSLTLSLRSLALASESQSATSSAKKLSLWPTFRTRKERVHLAQQTSVFGAIADPWLSLPDPESLADEAATQALLVNCCAKPERMGSKTPCVHRMLRDTIIQGGKLDAVTLCTLTEELILERDARGDCLLHVAARWGAHITTIMELLRILPRDKSDVLNHSKETFLHLLDPDAIKSTEVFAALIDDLRGQNFNFSQLDSQGRAFITRLVSRPGLPWKALLYLIEEAHPKDLHTWAMTNPAGHLGNLLLRHVHAKQRREGGHTLSLALYCQYLLHVKEMNFWHRQVRQCFNPMVGEADKHPVAPAPIMISAISDCPLHRFLGSAMSQGLHERDIDRYGAHNRPTAPIHTGSLLAAQLKQILRTKASVDSPEYCTGQTPLMVLLVIFGGERGRSDGVIVQSLDTNLLGCIQVLLDAGASLHHVDHQGNSPLHYAAALGLTLALKTFVNWQGDMGLTNKQGYTPPQLAAASLKYAKASLPQSSSRAARLYETISILHK
jgi:hypothetical protein